MTIYIDVFFLINFVIDFLLMTLACIPAKVHIIRRLASALFGTCYACLFVLKLPKILYTLPVRLAVFLVMCVICFAPCRLKYFVKKSFMAFFISVFFCGIIYTSQILTNTPTNHNISDFLLCSGICMGYFCFRFIISFTKKQTATGKYCIEIFYNNKKVKLFGICDSGNSLCEPYTKNPVIIADFKVFEKLFPGIKSAYELCEVVNPKDFKIIPYKTISQSGTVYGFVPDKAVIDNNEIKDVIIAAAPVSLEEDVLINPVLI